MKKIRLGLLWKFFRKNQKGFYFITFIFSSILFIPFSPSRDFDESTLRSSIESHQYRDSLLISLAVVIPAILDLIFDVIFASKQMSVQHYGYLPRAICLGFTLISTATLLTGSRQIYPISKDYWALIHFQMLGLISSAIAYLRIFSREFWSQQKIITLVMLVGFSGVFAVNSNKVASFENASGTLSILCASFAYVYFLYESYQWYQSSISILTIQQISPDLLLSIFYIIILHFSILGTFIFYIVVMDSDIQDFSMHFITNVQYTLIAVVVMMNCVHSRGIRLRNISDQDSLTIKRMVIRYFSHEIRNPINTITIGLDILKKHLSKILPRFPDLVSEIFGDLMLASTTTERILDDLLTYEKLQEKENRVQFENIRMWESVVDMVKASTVQCEHKNIKIHLDPNPNPDSQRHSQMIADTFVKADPTSMQQVLSTLINNAIKASPRNTTINVRCRIKKVIANTKEEDNSTKISNSRRVTNRVISQVFRIEVADLGDESIKDFELASNFDLSVLRGGQGACLGLWICKRIMDLQQGYIGVYPNRSGVGSTFYIEIPVVTSPENKLSGYFQQLQHHPQSLADLVLSLLHRKRIENSYFFKGTGSAERGGGRVGSKKSVDGKSKRIIVVSSRIVSARIRNNNNPNPDNNNHLNGLGNGTGSGLIGDGSMISPTVSPSTRLGERKSYATLAGGGGVLGNPEDQTMIFTSGENNGITEVSGHENEELEEGRFGDQKDQHQHLEHQLPQQYHSHHQLQHHQQLQQSPLPHQQQTDQHFYTETKVFRPQSLLWSRIEVHVEASDSAAPVMAAEPGAQGAIVRQIIPHNLSRTPSLRGSPGSPAERPLEMPPIELAISRQNSEKSRTGLVTPMMTTVAAPSKPKSRLSFLEEKNSLDSQFDRTSASPKPGRNLIFYDLSRTESNINDAMEESYGGLFTRKVKKQQIVTKPKDLNNMCLVVDDVTSNRKMLIRLLIDHFDYFEQAEDGKKAVEKMKILINSGHIPKVVFMDYVMPLMDGPSATKQIRALGYTGPIFGVTGNAQQKDIDYFITCGATRVFVKPIDVTDVTNALVLYK